MIERHPFNGGVEYYDSETGQLSRAWYPTSETETSAISSNQLLIDLDELAIWPQESTHA